MKLKIKNLNKSYETKKIFNDLNFTFESGKIYGLLGRNGAGKTTFFNILNDDIDCESKEFILSDSNQKIKDLSTSDIGYVTTIPAVPEFLTGYEFLKFFLEINKDKIKDLKDIDYYFSLVNIKEEDRKLLLKDYSHGMKNKMQFLINIITNPQIILLDEPLTSLDIVAQDEMKNLLKNLKNNHIIILSTHILELALDLCDEIVIINNKQFELVSKKNLLKETYKTEILNILKGLNNV